MCRTLRKEEGSNPVLDVLREVGLSEEFGNLTYNDLNKLIRSRIDVTKLLNLLAVKIKRIYWKEEKSRELVPLSKDFYVSVRVMLNGITSEEVKRSLEFKELMEVIIDLIRLRLQKIVGISLSSRSKEHLERMSLEEGVLYLTLSSLINRWEEELVSSLEGCS